MHLIENIYRRSIEDPYYRRAVRMKNRIIIDINTKSLSRKLLINLIFPLRRIFYFVEKIRRLLISH